MWISTWPYKLCIKEENGRYKRKEKDQKNKRHSAESESKRRKLREIQ